VANHWPQHYYTAFIDNRSLVFSVRSDRRVRLASRSTRVRGRASLMLYTSGIYIISVDLS
jgi:hypothetical protein